MDEIKEAFESLEVICLEAHSGTSALDTVQAALAAAEKDLLEQARLNGMGSEREAALLAKLERAEKERNQAEHRLKCRQEAEAEAHRLYHESMDKLPVEAKYLHDSSAHPADMMLRIISRAETAEQSLALAQERIKRLELCGHENCPGHGGNKDPWVRESALRNAEADSAILRVKLKHAEMSEFDAQSAVDKLEAEVKTLQEAVKAKDEALGRARVLITSEFYVSREPGMTEEDRLLLKETLSLVKAALKAGGAKP